ncbi:MAG: thioredoxin [Chloroflexi bacterium RBG_13_66_10]|jgi:thioredoxin 1|nr:MAG: thioredoxin [Chloroflexi bacterium RBG_13_66_10]
MVTEPVAVSDAAFDKDVLQSQLPVIVDFWADWCVPCRMVAPVLEKIAREYAGRVIVAKVDTDQDAVNAGKFGVQGIPTMLFIAGGVEVHRQVGAVPEKYLRDMVEEFLTTAEAAKNA